MKHIPVLVKEVYNNLPENLGVFLDGTVWHWGHTNYVINNTSTNGLFIVGVDKDPNMVSYVSEKIKPEYKNSFFRKGSYADLESITKEAWVTWFDAVLLDLWINMEHVKSKERGFSMKEEAYLDMRYDENSELTAFDVVNSFSINYLTWIFEKFWDIPEDFARKISEAIAKQRNLKKIKTTKQLVDLFNSLGMGYKKISVLFQCIRIEVNNELGELEEFLEKFWSYLNKNWRCLIITYHSIEDRMVKNYFRSLSKKSNFKLVNKKVIKPTFEEIKKNKASRSAKLRIIENL